jgi:hypothetical protein
MDATMLKKREKEWVSVTVSKSRMEKLYSKNERRMVFDLRSSCIVCGAATRGTGSSGTKIYEPEQVHTLTIPFPVGSERTPVPIEVVSHTYVCQKHAKTIVFQKKIEEVLRWVIIFGLFVSVFGGAAWAAFTSGDPPAKQIILFSLAFSAIVVFLCLLLMTVSRKIALAPSAKCLRMEKQGDEAVRFSFRVPGNAEKMADAYGLDLTDPSGTILGPVDEIEKKLLELPVTPYDNLPTGYYVYDGVYKGGDFDRAKSAARFLMGMYPPSYGSDHISACERGGGIRATYRIFRVGESRWRVVEDSEFID